MREQPQDPEDHDAALAALIVEDSGCPACGMRPERPPQLTRTPEGHILLTLDCPHCGAAGTVTIRINASLSAELTPGEAFYFSKLAALNETSVIRVRELLQRHTGDLIGLL
jgi:hypothetical protein